MKLLFDALLNTLITMIGVISYALLMITLFALGASCSHPVKSQAVDAPLFIRSFPPSKPCRTCLKKPPRLLKRVLE